MVGDNNAIICPELTINLLAYIRIKTTILALSHNKVYENLAITTVYDSVSNNQGK